VITNSYLPLLIVIFFAFITPIITARIKSFKIPVFVGELIIGLILANTIFIMIPIDSTSDIIFEFLKDFGFAFLMFLSGLEIDFHHLIHPNIQKEIKDKYDKIQKEHELCDRGKDEHCKHLEELRVHRNWHFPDIDINRKPYILGILVYGSTLGLSILTFYVISIFHPLNYWFTGVMFSTTSVGLVFPVLNEMKLKNDVNYKQKIIISSIIADFVSMLLITIIIILNTPGVGFDLLLVPLLFVVFIALFQIFRIFKRHPKWYSKIFLKETKVYEVKTTASIFLLLLFIFLSFIFGIEMILGAFLAGILISLVAPQEKVHQLYEKLHVMGYGFLIPIFFITIGRDIHFGSTLLSWDAIGFALIIIGVSFLIKIIPNSIIMKLGKNSVKEGISAGILESARLSLVIAAAEIGIFYGFFSDLILESAILVVVITSIISPILFIKFMGRKKKDEK